MLPEAIFGERSVRGWTGHPPSGKVPGMLLTGESADTAKVHILNITDFRKALLRQHELATALQVDGVPAVLGAHVADEPDETSGEGAYRRRSAEITVRGGTSHPLSKSLQKSCSPVISLQ